MNSQQPIKNQSDNILCWSFQGSLL
jgi:hypothetical protein